MSSSYICTAVEGLSSGTLQLKLPLRAVLSLVADSLLYQFYLINTTHADGVLKTAVSNVDVQRKLC